MTLIDDSVIGRELEPFVFSVEPAKVRYFLRSLGTSEPIFESEDVARERGLRGIPVPPGLVIFVSAQDSYSTVFQALGLDYKTDLFAGVDYTFHEPIVVGDQIRGRTVVEGLSTKEGKQGALQFVALRTEYTNQDGKLVLTETSTVAHRA